MILAVDFDGTITMESAYPQIGLPNWDMIEYLKKAKDGGNRIILWSCREGNLLDDAVKFCEQLGLHFDAVNDNLPEFTEKYGSNSRKVFADYYIDDKCFKASEVTQKVSKTGKVIGAHRRRSGKVSESDEVGQQFESLWKMYPKKLGKGQITRKCKETLLREVGYDQMTRCIERYKDSIRGKDMQYVMHGSTFFHSGYVDFLDENTDRYVPETEQKTSSVNRETGRVWQ